MRLETIHIEGKSFFGIAIPYDTDLIAKAKKLNGRWHPKSKLWLFTITPERKEELNQVFNLQDSAKTKSIIPKQKSKVPKEYLEQLERRRYSPNTIQTYISLFEQFLNYFPDNLSSILNTTRTLQKLMFLFHQKQMKSSAV